MEQEKNTFEKIYEVVKQIPKGNVATYGQVAALAGNRRWARVVGYALHANPSPDEIPCYRVVNREGRLSEAFAFGGRNRQQDLLEQDGIEVVDGKVDLKKVQWSRIAF
ncbi:MAG: MGMT family protein [Roseburia sp.]|uniref:MGMT family protein n=1 Tax=Roseburia sp. 831b TaxID=1261635 RepID=UPI000952F630|nr:MGMT family protein [Roseburia sp. 831b]MCI5918268.1 MGMT family protein [Roseburia sp.]MDD6216798.1 MGMT family protein [Roseburia sp.]WVK72979.1 MGMT family protein [Roseburia sp. 831b]